MWYREIPLAELSNSGAWKLERYRSQDDGSFTEAAGTVAIGDIVGQRDDTADPTTSAFAKLPYIGLEAVESGTGEILRKRSALEQEIRSRSKVFRVGDVLYGRLRAYLNKVALVDSDMPVGSCSGEFYVLVPDTSQVLPHFLRWLLSSEDMVGYVKLRLAGATHPRLALDDLLAYRVKLPSLERQEHAVSILQEAQARRRWLVSELCRLPAETSARVSAIVYVGREYNERRAS